MTTTLIHPTAVIHSGASLHPSVKVGPYAVIGEHVTIGPNTDIGAHVVIDGHTTLGAHNRVYPGAAIGLEPQDLKYDGAITQVEIGDHNLIREYVTINRPTTPDVVTRLGNHNLLMAYAHVAHNCILEDQIVLANSVALAGHVHVESWARISGLVGVHQFVHIGRYAYIGGLSRIDRDVPPFTMVNGNPALVRGLNQVGLQRAGLADQNEGQDYRQLKQAYRLVYRSGASLASALDKLEPWSDNELVRHFSQFLKASSQQPDRRGATPSRKRSSRSTEAD
ncbi:acyl-[acyl-carrier-protein]--UDP-N-acetylglucosamine O-acyltransferase [Leptolyngbya sp. BL0902]|uniref:acyl-ACP--UDP-N-acetylglucosamine O-acyltransferase n=1 Tax=Leptolyngbya sp. BL0902 TaxID=1115757 RepID=UPI0019365AD1|nr:acyl-ACP--UDP-N-acetylglucosamine O-acyltransferase [Leptolyngbya sp. BL0902]QQE66206.1 acyl-[acyl-carrier-protein]--UDP-N-acetylglucosamine O-acyltransferase [Leptolyngbya sp. BL0902]